MNVTAVFDAVKKRGHFYNYKKAAKDHEESTKAVESARAALSLLDRTGAKAKKLRKKKTKEVERTPLQRSKTPSQMPRKPRMLLKQMTR
jgi:hypothetical protein